MQADALQLERQPLFSVATLSANHVVGSPVYSNSDGSVFVDGVAVQIGSVAIADEVLLFETSADGISAVIVNKTDDSAFDVHHCGVNSASRERRQQPNHYDQHYGANACYTGDDTLHSIEIGVAVGYFAFKRWGGRRQAVADHVAYVLHRTNTVYSNQFHVHFTIGTLHVSVFPRQEEYDSHTADNVTCSSSIRQQLRGVGLFNTNTSVGAVGQKHLMWHLIDDCAWRTIGRESTIIGLADLNFAACSAASAVTYIVDRFEIRNYIKDDVNKFFDRSDMNTWTMFAHELGHNLGVDHPFGTNATDQGTFGGIMDYGNSTLVYGNSRKNAYSQASSKTICFNLDTRALMCSDELRMVPPPTLCGNNLIDPGEQCECAAKDTTVCRHCTNCTWHAGKSCSPETLQYDACRCSDTGVKKVCHGVCNQQGGCVPTPNLCSSVCFTHPGNTCMVVCTDLATSPASCHQEMFVPENFPCSRDGVWGTCVPQPLDNNHTVYVCNADSATASSFVSSVGVSTTVTATTTRTNSSTTSTVTATVSTATVAWTTATGTSTTLGTTAGTGASTIVSITTATAALTTGTLPQPTTTATSSKVTSQSTHTTSTVRSTNTHAPASSTHYLASSTVTGTPGNENTRTPTTIRTTQNGTQRTQSALPTTPRTITTTQTPEHVTTSTATFDIDPLIVDVHYIFSIADGFEIQRTAYAGPNVTMALTSDHVVIRATVCSADISRRQFTWNQAGQSTTMVQQVRTTNSSAACWKTSQRLLSVNPVTIATYHVQP